MYSCCSFVTGKHSMKKDDFLTTIMLVPPKQRTRIHAFDPRTQEEAFTVSPEGLKGVSRLILPTMSSELTHCQWNINTLVVESAQAREDRKKRVSIRSWFFFAPLTQQSVPVPPFLFNRKSSNGWRSCINKVNFSKQRESTRRKVALLCKHQPPPRHRRHQSDLKALAHQGTLRPHDRR